LSKPDSTPKSGRRSRARVITAGVVGGLFALVGVGYVAGYAMAGDNVPSKTTVAGVQVGGVSAEQALDLLRDGLEPKAEAPITLTAGDESTTLDPADAGLAIDYEATIAKLGAGRSWAPTDIWQVLTGGGSVDPVVQVDDAALASAVKTAATTLDATARDATITLDGVEIVTTDAVQGVAVDQAATADALRTSWLTTTTVDAPTVVTEPSVTTDEVKALATDTLAPALSGPITLTTDKGKVTLSPAMIAKATTITSEDGLVSAETSPAKLWDAAQDQIDDLTFTEGRDATWKLVSGSPTVVPSSDGQGISEDEFTKQVTALLTSTTGRTAKLATVKSPAGFTTAMAKKLGVKEVTGEFTTYFPYAEYRNNNLSRAAASINNAFLRPGEIFSLNDTLGQRTAANGYMDGWVIVGNQLQKEVGGGVSQSATTTFNAAFFAGLKDVEHHPHSLYFDRYPAGREATVYYGSLDLRFQNDTPYGVLMQAYVKKASPGGRGSITVRVWSTRVYDVKSSDLVKSNFTTGVTVRNDSLKCHAQSADQGFDVNYSRLFYKAGSLVRTEKFFWRYKPTDAVICTNPNASDG